MADTTPKLIPAYIRYGALLTGLAASLGFRALVVLEHLEPAWMRPVWYMAVIGNFFFFYYRFRITGRRKRTIHENELARKISDGEPLNDDDRIALSYLLDSIRKSPENINYIIISLFSLLAIAGDLAFTYLG